MKKTIAFSILLLSLLTFTTIFNSCQKQENIDPQINDETAGELQVRNMGWEPMPETEYANIPVAESGPIAKATVYNLNSPPAGDQGSENSCTAWATAYAARSIYTQRWTGGSYSYSKNIMSPAYVYNQINYGNCSNTAPMTDALEVIRNQGVCRWSWMPYVDGQCTLWPNYYQMSDASYFRINGYYRVNINVYAIKSQLSAGNPVIVGGPVYEPFLNLGYNQVQTYIAGNNSGGHAYCVVGYDDSKQAFKVINSWGTSWGTDGYGYISYNIIGAVWQEAFVMY